MESDLPTATPTGMGNGMSGQVSISINDDAPSHSNPQVSLYILLLYWVSLFYMYPLMLVRYGIMSQNNKDQHSRMEMNGLFMSMSFVAVYVATLTSWILIICTRYLYKQMKGIHYAILRCIGLFSTTIAIFSISLVLLVPSNLYWIEFLLVCVAFGIAFGICYLDYHKPYDNDDNNFPITYTGLFFVPLLPVLVIFLPNNLNWIVNVVVFSYCAIEFACVCSSKSNKLSVIKEKNEVYNLEEAPHQVIQQDRNIEKTSNPSLC